MQNPINHLIIFFGAAVVTHLECRNAFERKKLEFFIAKKYFSHQFRERIGIAFMRTRKQS